MTKIKFFTAAALVALFTSCGENDVPTPDDNDGKIYTSEIRTLDDAYDIAKEAVAWLDYGDSRGEVRYLPSKDDIKVLKSAASRGEENDTLMYVVNYENEKGFAIIPANRNMPKLLAVTESGSYIPNEKTDVEPFNDYMDFIIQSIGDGGITDPGKDDNKPVPMEEWKEVEHESVNSQYGLKKSTIWGNDGIEGKYFENNSCGFGPLAASLCLAYFQYPSSMTLTHNGNAKLTIDWNTILQHDASKNVYSGSKFVRCDDGLTPASQDVISRMCKEVAVRANATIKNGKTTVSITNLANALKSLGFSATDNAKLEERIISSPIVYVPYAQNGNGEWNMWIIDGYKYSEITYDKYKRINDPNMGITRPWEYISTRKENHEYVHHNWGWNGKYNGWFSVGYWVANKGNKYDTENTGIAAENVYNYMTNRHILSVKRAAPEPEFPGIEL